jgi:hypothetical protein
MLPTFHYMTLHQPRGIPDKPSLVLVAGLNVIRSFVNWRPCCLVSVLGKWWRFTLTVSDPHV